LQRLLQSVSQSNKALEKISTSDELTGVSNYRAYRVQLEDIWRQYRGSQEQVSLIKLNIDYYHEFNAHYGQEAGDRHLQQLARLLNKQLSHKNQMVARLHGAELALLLPGVSCEDARQLAVNIRQAFAADKIEHLKSACADHLTLSIGLGSQTVAQGSYSRELLVRTDAALKLAKERGRDRLEVMEG
jgi:two-component system chemotaxis family response regulator WspR